MPQSGRILALDPGRKRIGVAISDELRITAQGLPTVERVRIREDIQRLTDCAMEWAAVAILVGNPLHMSGDESRGSERSRELAERLSQHSGIPYVMWDERFTSKIAEYAMREGRMTRERRRENVYRMAAVLLLDSFLEWLRWNQTDGETH
jgi:putative holliday junction resolvase